jgi:PAS domain S-box-containing protein
MLGYAPDALIGSSFWALVHPDDRSRVRLTPRPKTERGEAPPAFRLLHKLGRPVSAHMEGSLISFRDRTALAGFMIDVSAWELCIQTLRESLERYETILNDVDVQLGEMDLQGNLTFINDAGCRIWGLDREELLGLNYRSCMNPETSGRFYKMYEEVFRTGIPVKNVVLDIRDRNGVLKISPFWRSTSVALSISDSRRISRAFPTKCWLCS